VEYYSAIRRNEYFCCIWQGGKELGKLATDHCTQHNNAAILMICLLLPELPLFFWKTCEPGRVGEFKDGQGKVERKQKVGGKSRRICPVRRWCFPGRYKRSSSTFSENSLQAQFAEISFVSFDHFYSKNCLEKLGNLFYLSGKWQP